MDPGLSTTVISGGGCKVTTANTAVKVIQSAAHIAKFTGSRARKLTIQSNNLTIVVGDSTCLNTSTTGVVGIQLGAGASLTLNDIIPTDLYANSTVTANTWSYLVEM